MRQFKFFLFRYNTYYISMSLFVVGSVSRITSNIVTHLAEKGKFSTITIADLLPSYQYHHRFYRLQRQWQQKNVNAKLNLTRLTNINDLLLHQKYDNVLFVTHDYYSNVTSKTKLMELTALACKFRKHLYYVTPVEYDHFGYENPELNYFRAEDKVFQLNSNSTIIRSDVQDQTEILATLKSSQSPNFKPKIVQSEEFARTVCDIITAQTQGKRILVRGTESTSTDYNHNIEQVQYKHSRENITNLVSKYSGLTFSGYNGEQRIVKSSASPKVENKEEQKSQKASH